MKNASKTRCEDEELESEKKTATVNAICLYYIYNYGYVKRRDPFFDKWRSQCAQNAIHFCWWQLVKYLFHLMVNHSSRAHILCTLTSLRLQCSASPSIFQLYSLIVTAKKNSLMMGIYSECWQTREWHPFWRPQRRVLLPSILYEGTLRTSLFFIWFCTKGDNISGVIRG